MTELIFREPDPTRRPYMVGRMPSKRDGRVLDFSAGYTPDGEARLAPTDRGLIRDSTDPFFYLCVFGGTMEMSQTDMHECVEEMTYTRRKKAQANPRQIATEQQFKQKVSDLIDAIKDAQVGRTRFAT
jgi:hypothetical protein